MRGSSVMPKNSRNENQVKIRVLKMVIVSIIIFIIYMAFSKVSLYSIVFGIIIASCSGVIVSNIIVKNPWKALDLRRYLWFIIYILQFFFIVEIRSHIDMIKRILSRNIPLKPGIVKIHYNVDNDYAIAMIANSITNTPGTVVIDINEDEKALYVNWIFVQTTEPEVLHKTLIERFELLAKRVFD